EQIKNKLGRHMPLETGTSVGDDPLTRGRLAHHARGSLVPCALHRRTVIPMDGNHSLQFETRPHASPTPAAERAAMVANPGFGRVFTDHMVVIRYAEGRGWHDARIEARAPIQLDPACAVLHYAQEIFEGLKAYRTPDGGAAMFRPDANARRFRQSAERMAMAPLPEGLFLEAVRGLVRIDRDWIPGMEGGSLYIRPFMFASEVFLGVKPSSEYLF